jgi:potassium channel subfamily K
MPGHHAVPPLSTHFHDHRRRPRNVDLEDGDAVEAEEEEEREDLDEEEELRRMSVDDDAYEAQLGGEASSDVRESSNPHHRHHHHTATKTGQKQASAVKPNGLPKTVTIAAPEDSPEKNLYTTPLGGTMQTRSQFGLSRTNTSKTSASFATTMSDAWGKRHDPRHRGFWQTMWVLLVGSKELPPDIPREGEEGYIPPKYRWSPILSGLIQPFSILLEIPSE